jgi:predicted dehydrogenase
MKTPLKIAILGCGGMGSGHVLAITGHDREKLGFLSYNAYSDGQLQIADLNDKLVLAGVYDIDSERMKWVAENGWHCYTSYDEILADPDVDIVLIATPNHLHKEQAIRALRAGKHVLCEKPVMMSSQDLIDVLAVAKEEGRVFYPRQNRRWDYDYLVAKKIMDDHMLGDVFSVESTFVGSRGIPGDWRKVKVCGGGMMLDWGVHLLDRLLMMIPGKITSVYCRCSHVTCDECDDGFRAWLNFENGITARVVVSTCNFINTPHWYIAGREGTAQIDDFSGNGRIVRVTNWNEGEVKPVQAGEGLTKTMAPRDANSTEEIELPKVTIDRNALYINLVDTINGTAEQIVKPEEALRCLRLMEALFESDEKDSVIPFEQ